MYNYYIFLTKQAKLHTYELEEKGYFDDPNDRDFIRIHECIDEINTLKTQINENKQYLGTLRYMLNRNNEERIILTGKMEDLNNNKRGNEYVLSKIDALYRQTKNVHIVYIIIILLTRQHIVIIQKLMINYTMIDYKDKKKYYNVNNK